MEKNLANFKKQLKKNGVYYTPVALAEMMKGLITVPYQNVYDPTCGQGNLLSVFDDDIEKYGQELFNDELEKANSTLDNFTGTIGDTLTNPAFIGKRFDVIMANPPYSVKWDSEALKDDERFTVAPVLAPNSKADFAFILHILHYLTDNGQAIILSFPGILYRGNREYKIRRWLVENGYIEKIIEVPPKQFIDTPIATVILVLRKDRKDKGITFERNGKSKQILFDEIVENDFTLSPNLYIPDEVERISINPVEIENQARQQVKDKIINELNFSRAVVELDPLIDKQSFNDFCDDLITTIKQLYFEVKTEERI
ncbi:MAG: N-6 DNA methylase [Gammaproteobacteria bacterium]|nr:N-6 DNA methylase [Gammaproteobacteria bacterium]